MKGPDVAVLCSGGLDSAVLVAHEGQRGLVLPIYVRSGLAWESQERTLLEQLLATPPYEGRVAPLATVAMDAADLYPPGHWALTGHPPAYDTADEEVYLPGRNVMLLSKAAVLCAVRGIHLLALGPLAGNPFPDATPEFFSTFARGLSLGLAHHIEVVAPFATLHKEDVIKLGAGLGVPFELTLSCMNPSSGQHCGACSKCRERQDAFADAGVEDPTRYLAPAPRKAGTKKPGVGC